MNKILKGVVFRCGILHQSPMGRKKLRLVQSVIETCRGLVTNYGKGGGGALQNWRSAFEVLPLQKGCREWEKF